MIFYAIRDIILSRKNRLSLTPKHSPNHFTKPKQVGGPLSISPEVYRKRRECRGFALSCVPSPSTQIGISLSPVFPTV